MVPRRILTGVVIFHRLLQLKDEGLVRASLAALLHLARHLSQCVKA